MKLNNFIEGLHILQPYYKDPNGYQIGAEHDIFYAYATAKPLPKEAVKRLCEMDWFQPDVEIPDEDGDGEFRPEHYDPEEGWAAFT